MTLGLMDLREKYSEAHALHTLYFHLAWPEVCMLF